MPSGVVGLLRIADPELIYVDEADRDSGIAGVRNRSARRRRSCRHPTGRTATGPGSRPRSSRLRFLDVNPIVLSQIPSATETARVMLIGDEMS